jgi:hypothetical protein
MTVVKRAVRSRLMTLNYRKLLERTAVLYGRELDRLNRRVR